MAESTAEYLKVDFRNKGKEEFTIEFNQITNELTLSGKFGIVRNKIKLKDAEHQFERMLKIAKLKFLKNERYTQDSITLHLGMYPASIHYILYIYEKN